MTIASEIQRIKDNIAASYAECSAKGATLPAVENSASLPDTIASISGGGGGATITAVNKTGAAISQGDKVWLSSNAQIAGSNYQIGNSGNWQPGALGCIDRLGTFGCHNDNLYSIGTDSASYVGKTPSTALIGSIMYMDGNSMFANGAKAVRIDSASQYATNLYCVGGDIFIANRGSKAYQLNITTGAILNTFTNANEMVSNYPAKVGDYIYRLYGSNSSSNYKWLIDYKNKTLVRSSYKITNAPYQYDMYNAGVTMDNKFIFASKATNPAIGEAGYLYIIEVLDNGNLKGLSQSEMPVELQKWFSTNCGFNFNPYTGILCIHEYNGTDYGIYKYLNGVWSKIPVNLDLPNDAIICGPITVSDDLSKACYSYYLSSSTTVQISKIVNLTTTSGYAAVPYRFYTINEDTVTGVAKGAASVDDLFEASIASEG